MTHVIACIDHSAAALAVCEYAIWASQRLQAPLKFLHVLDRGQYPAPTDLSGNIGLGAREHLLDQLAALDEERGRVAREHGQHLLDEAKARARNAGIEKPHCSQRHGDLVESVKELETDTRLLVLGHQGESSSDLATQVGSNIESVVRTLSRPILVTPRSFQSINRFLIAFDGSPTSRKCVDMIASSPLLKGMDCHLLLVGETNEDNQAHLAWATLQLNNAGFIAKTAIRAGNTEDTLLRYCEENAMGLLAMGAYGHSRIRQFLVGSTTSNLLARATIPLLLLR